MAAAKRFKTKNQGVFYIMGKTAGGKLEKTFYIRYRRGGKLIEEKAGRQHQDDMTPSRAAGLRSQRMDGKELSNRAKREAEAAAATEEKDRYTIERLWIEYCQTRKPGKGLDCDKSRYTKYLQAPFGDKEPKDVVKLEVERLRIKLGKTRSPQTVKHVLNLLTWIVNFGVKNALCPGFPFKVTKPTVNNLVTEDLTPAQLADLLAAIDADENIQVANMMLLALYSGLRRGELFKLQWDDVKFDRGFILIRDPKGGVDAKIPMNAAARELLQSHPRSQSPFVFPGENGRQRVTAQTALRRIRDRAELPKNFRPLHGLRHAFASMLASSGEVDLYTLQRLLTHKTPIMTQRYAHLSDRALSKASSVASDIITKAAKPKAEVKKITRGKK